MDEEEVKKLKERCDELERVVKDLLELLEYRRAVVEGCWPVNGPDGREIVARAERLIAK